jgi:plasmid stability protein
VSNLLIKGVDVGLMRRIKSQAAADGKTLKDWVVVILREAIGERIAQEASTEPMEVSTQKPAKRGKTEKA